jgi:hypothetical protein
MSNEMTGDPFPGPPDPLLEALCVALEEAPADDPLVEEGTSEGSYEVDFV